MTMPTIKTIPPMVPPTAGPMAALLRWGPLFIGLASPLVRDPEGIAWTEDVEAAAYEETVIGDASESPKNGKPGRY